jgi:hypothetical protein
VAQDKLRDTHAVRHNAYKQARWVSSELNPSYGAGITVAIEAIGAHTLGKRELEFVAVESM